MSTYNIFISHSWSYSDQYQGLVRLLNNTAYFSYKNYSVPKDDPIHNASNKYELKKAIRNQMQYASCIIILAGVYSTYSKWINIEFMLLLLFIFFSIEYNKSPILICSLYSGR